MGADNVFCCTEPPRKDPKSAFVVVAAVESAPNKFKRNLRSDGRNRWILVLCGRERSSWSRWNAHFFVQSSTTYSTDLLWIIILKVIE